MAEQEETDYLQADPEVTGLLDEDEFFHALEVFSDDKEHLSTAYSVLHPFLKSLGIRGDQNSALIGQIKEASSHNMIEKFKLIVLIKRYLPSLKECWPSHTDVLKAFKVFDTEGVGFIKVTMLKRFLVQSQLEVDEAVLERLIRDNCNIDGDDLINYSEFVQNISRQFEEVVKFLLRLV